MANESNPSRTTPSAALSPKESGTGHSSPGAPEPGAPEPKITCVFFQPPGVAALWDNITGPSLLLTAVDMERLRVTKIGDDYKIEPRDPKDNRFWMVPNHRVNNVEFAK